VWGSLVNEGSMKILFLLVVGLVPYSSHAIGTWEGWMECFQRCRMTYGSTDPFCTAHCYKRYNNLNRVGQNGEQLPDPYAIGESADEETESAD
jgi:hypothetical protein